LFLLFLPPVVVWLRSKTLRLWICNNHKIPPPLLLVLQSRHQL
jgi:hypothetical protein